MAKKPGRKPGTKLTSAEQAQRANAPMQHGGYSALARIRDGRPFIGLALEAQRSVEDELSIDPDTLAGIDAVRLKRAIRMEAAARLFDAAALDAADRGDLSKWASLQKRAGWIGAKAFRAMGQIRENMVDGRPATADALEVARAALARKADERGAPVVIDVAADD